MMRRTLLAVASFAGAVPHPENWRTLIAKVQELDRAFEDWPPEALPSNEAPTLFVIGDAGIVRPERAVVMLRLLGDGVPGDLADLPRAWLAPMIAAFLDAPMPKPK